MIQDMVDNTARLYRIYQDEEWFDSMTFPDFVRYAEKTKLLEKRDIALEKAE